MSYQSFYQSCHIVNNVMTNLVTLLAMYRLVKGLVRTELAKTRSATSLVFENKA